MNKKAIELSINFLVIIIISIVMLSSGILIIKKYFGTATEIKEQLDEQTLNRIEDLVSDGGTVVVPFKRKVVEAGEAELFGLGILNLDTTNDEYKVFINLSKFITRDQIEEDDPGATGWLLYESQHTIAYKETKKIPIRVHVPVGVEPGSYIFNIYVNKGTYGLTKITVVIP